MRPGCCVKARSVEAEKVISGCYAYLGRQDGSLDLVVVVREGGMKLRLGIHLVMNVGRW